MSELKLEYSIDGVSYTVLTIPTQPTGTGTAVWRLISGIALPSNAEGISNLRLRWTNTSSGTGTPQFRIDDITLQGTVVATPDISLSSPNPAVPAGNMLQNSVKNLIYAFSTAVTTANASLTGVSFTTTNAAADISKYQLYYNTSNNFATATQLGSDITTGLGTGTHSFSGFTQKYYCWHHRLFLDNGRPALRRHHWQYFAGECAYHS